MALVTLPADALSSASHTAPPRPPPRPPWDYGRCSTRLSPSSAIGGSYIYAFLIGGLRGEVPRARFIGLMISCETDGYESKPSSKGRSHTYRGEAAQLQAAENGQNSIRRPANHSVRHVPDNLIKEEPSTGGMGCNKISHKNIRWGCPWKINLYRDLKEISMVIVKLRINISHIWD